MLPTFVTLFGTIWLPNHEHKTDLQTSQAKHNSQVTNKTTIYWKLLWIQAGLNKKSSTTYATHISEVQVLNDQVLFLCWAWMD